MLFPTLALCVSVSSLVDVFVAETRVAALRCFVTNYYNAPLYW
ncbi:MAG: hypothetical protein N2Z22_06550 [Turneriella sp.]|nr:hypothetical protein [Turneriella sp.]